LTELIDEMARVADTGVEIFHLTADFLAYHGELDLSLRLLRQAWPVLREHSDLFDWAQNEYCNRGISLEIRTALEANPNLAGNDPSLLDRLRYYTNDLNLDVIAARVEMLAGRRPIPEKESDYRWQPVVEKGRRRSEDWQRIPDQARDQLTHLMATFQGELRRQEGVDWVRGMLAADGLFRYLVERGLGRLQNSGKPTPNVHPLCPTQTTFDRFLARCFDLLSGGRSEGFAVYELVPAWLRFLRRHGLLTVEQHRKAFEELSTFRKLLADIAARDWTDPTLGAGLSAWDNPPEA
jgi:hypothetical protein